MQEGPEISELSDESTASFIEMLKAAIRSIPKEEADPNVEQPLPDPKPTERIGRFEVLGDLGRGTFGTVLKVRDPMLGRDRAMKIPNPQTLASPKAMSKFVAEALIASKNDHPNVVRVLEADQIGSLFYMIMEYCPGGSLADWLSKRPNSRVIPPRWVAGFVAEIADGVHHGHLAGILHRDLKPGNVLLVRVGESEDEDPPAFRPKVADFGLAKFFEEGSRLEQSDPSDIVGTVAYMSPEQARGDIKIGPSSDVWSIGVILHTLLTRKHPFSSGMEGVSIGRILDESPPAQIRSVRSDVPRELDTICRTCLAKSATDRYESAASLADDLRRYLRDEPVRGTPWWKRARTTLRRYWPVAAAAAVLLVAMITAGLALEKDARKDAAGWLDLVENLPIHELASHIAKRDPPDWRVTPRLDALFEIGDPDRKLASSIALVRSRPECSDYVFKRLLEASPEKIGSISNCLAGRMPRFLDKLEAAAMDASGLGDEAGELRRANAAISLFLMNKEEMGLQVLGLPPGSEARTCLIHLLGPAGVSVTLLIQTLDSASSPLQRMAIIQALGEVPLESFSSDESDRLVRILLNFYEQDRDPGVHGSAKWLLMLWTSPESHRDENLEKSIRDGMARIDAAHELPPDSPLPWRIGPLGMTMVRLKLTDQGQTRLVEVADCEVTIRQFLSYRPEQTFLTTGIQREDAPAHAINGGTAIGFCNWLSEREGLEPGQLAYRKIGEAEPDSRRKLEPFPDTPDRLGYRLLTSSEWESACRAGSLTRRHFGASDKWLKYYAWYYDNSGGSYKSVGTRKPNEFGLFDTLGNVREWSVQYRDGHQIFTQKIHGGSIRDFPLGVSSLDTLGSDVGRWDPYSGFRIARTMRVVSPEE